MDRRRDEKRTLEENAALSLVEILNSKYGSSFQVVEHGDKPDIVIADSCTQLRIGVEVTHLFQSAEEARQIFGRASEPIPLSESSDDYIKGLNGLLLKKAVKAKGYTQRFPLALLIRVVSRIFNRDELIANRSRIQVPQSDFRYIWVLFYDFNQKCWCDLEQIN